MTQPSAWRWARTREAGAEGVEGLGGADGSGDVAELANALRAGGGGDRGRDGDSRSRQDSALSSTPAARRTRLLVTVQSMTRTIACYDATPGTGLATDGWPFERLT